MGMTRKQDRRRARGLAALLALLLSVQAIAWVAHAVEHGGWLAQARGEAGNAASLVADEPDRAHVHGGPFARCGACDALAQLQGAAPPAPTGLVLLRAAPQALPDPGALQAERILARATARAPPRG